MLTGQNYIGGEWSDTLESTPNINPSDTREFVGLFANGSRADIATAAAAARGAFPAWSQTTPQLRHDLLKVIGAEILARRDELGTLLSAEEGKPRAEGIGECTRAGQIFEFFAGECLRIPGVSVRSIRPGVDIEVWHEPLGVIGVITPWNFPIAIPAWKTAAALAYGNCVVFKPAELVPASAHALASIVARSGLPAGVFNLVMGPGSELGPALTSSPDVDAVSFTGSTGVGALVASSCMSDAPMKRIQLEMGGKNALIILDDADLERAVDCAVNGALFSTGQRCTASSRLIVTPAIYSEFVRRLIERTASLTVGHALEPGTDIGPVADQRQLDKNLSYIEVGKSEGATLRWGGERLDREHPGFYMQPAIFTGVNPAMRIAKEEIFGPIAAVIRVKDYDEALAVANDSAFGLSAGICTRSLKHATHFKRNIQVGMAMVNLPTAGVDYHVPFGGRKASNYGPREQGQQAREFFTVTKTIYTDPQ